MNLKPLMLISLVCINSLMAAASELAVSEPTPPHFFFETINRFSDPAFSPIEISPEEQASIDEAKTYFQSDQGTLLQQTFEAYFDLSTLQPKNIPKGIETKTQHDLAIEVQRLLTLAGCHIKKTGHPILENGTEPDLTSGTPVIINISVRLPLDKLGGKPTFSALTKLMTAASPATEIPSDVCAALENDYLELLNYWVRGFIKESDGTTLGLTLDLKNE
jgi:hypothetical protein